MDNLRNLAIGILYAPRLPQHRRRAARQCPRRHPTVASAGHQQLMNHPLPHIFET
jgi:hypothetical protein